MKARENKKRKLLKPFRNLLTLNDFYLKLSLFLVFATFIFVAYPLTANLIEFIIGIDIPSYSIDSNSIGLALTFVTSLFVFNKLRYQRKNHNQVDGNSGLAKVRPAFEEGEIVLKNFGEGPALKYRLIVFQGEKTKSRAKRGKLHTDENRKIKAQKLGSLDRNEIPINLEEGETISITENDNFDKIEAGKELKILQTFESINGCERPQNFENATTRPNEELISEYKGKDGLRHLQIRENHIDNQNN